MQPLPVYLDMRHVTKIDPVKRFPGISKFLAQHGLELRRDLIPVRPAAHYLMGGIRTDVHGRTSLQRLYAAGEAACTGVHGANRLASNSLLEGLVFGARAAEAMTAESALPRSGAAISVEIVPAPGEFLDLREKLQHTLWEKAGLLRDAQGLHAGHQEVRSLQRETPQQFSRALLELRNLQTIGTLIIQSALAREESRGAHYRNDFPKRDDANFAKHSVMRRSGITFEDF